MEGFIRGGHRKEVQRSKPESMPRMDSGAKEPRALASGPDVRAKTFWLLLGRLPKVTRRKGGTLSRRYLNNGYTHNPPGIYHHHRWSQTSLPPRIPPRLKETTSC